MAPNKVAPYYTPRHKFDIFLSYSHKNYEEAVWVKEYLEKQQLSVCWDGDALHEYGGDIFEFMGDGITKSDFFVPIFSQDYVDSKNCRKELKLASQQHKNMFPVYLPGFSAVPNTLQVLVGQRYVEYPNIDTLVQDIRGWQNKENKEPINTFAQQTYSSNTSHTTCQPRKSSGESPRSGLVCVKSLMWLCLFLCLLSLSALVLAIVALERANSNSATIVALERAISNHSESATKECCGTRFKAKKQWQPTGAYFDGLLPVISFCIDDGLIENRTYAVTLKLKIQSQASSSKQTGASYPHLSGLDDLIYYVPVNIEFDEGAGGYSVKDEIQRIYTSSYSFVGALTSDCIIFYTRHHPDYYDYCTFDGCSSLLPVDMTVHEL